MSVSGDLTVQVRFLVAAFPGIGAKSKSPYCSQEVQALTLILFNLTS